MTGTSCILTLIADAPLLDPEVCNVATVEGHWGPFVLLETGGDAMRWARRAFHEKALSYDEITARAAAAPAGSDGLFFMPYLTGERLGAHRNARAQFFGLGAAHGLAHLHRAVLEGVAFAAARHLRIMEKAADRRIERVIASGGGAKTELVAEDQGERLRRADPGPEGAGMRRHRLRGDGGDGRRPVRSNRGRDRLLCPLCRRDQPRPRLGANLCADAADLRPALRPFAGALRRPRRARGGSLRILTQWTKSSPPFVPTSSPARRRLCRQRLLRRSLEARAMDESQQGRVGFGRAYGGPGKYIQRPGEIDRLPAHLKSLGDKAFLLVDGFVLDSMGDGLRELLAASGLPYEMERFHGECCSDEIARVETLVRSQSATVVVGIGGGKTADTAKVAACRTGARLVIAPTIASTDAPCSAVAVRYSTDGVYQESISLPRNPDIVLVDSAVIVRAPARFLVAGIGDALSTWFEARSNVETRSRNYIASGFPAPAAGLALARVCYDVLLRDALAAKYAAERGALTQAVENIIEANTLLSGLGFENCGVSGGHGIHDGLTALDETHGFYHGEKVAFGTLCLLMLEGRPLAEIEATARFCRALGLPSTLADLKLANASKAAIERVAAAALAPGSATWRSAAPLSVATVRDAIIALDAFTSSLATSS